MIIMMKKINSFIHIWILAFVVSILTFTACSDSENSSKEETIYPQQIAIIDAGSSGSRLYVYEIADNGKTVNQVYPSNADEKKAAKGPALSKVANTDEGVTEFLNTMASKYTGKSEKEIPLYILATAGMRQQPEADTKQLYAKLNSHKETINGLKLASAITISGQYEGLYAWISVNFTDKTLNTTSQKGIIEVGGASMQTTFSTTSTLTPTYAQSVITHPIYGNIYSKSCMGGVDVVYASVEDKTQIPETFNIPVEDVSSIVGNTQFYYRGTPLSVYSQGLAEHGGLDGFREYLKQQESDPYHTYFNSYYLTWLIEHTGLAGRATLPSFDAEWTEGAAIDIVVNKRQPEQYDYNLKK